jgi:hypothetical protein
MVNRKTITVVAISLFVFASVVSTFAQGRYANVYSRNDVSNFIRNLENSSDVFSRDFKNAGGTTSAERRNVDRFENAVDRLRSRFDSNNSWWASRNEVQGIMTEARSVNIMMNNERYARRLEVQWRNLRRDVNKLADTYELPELGGGDSGGPWNPGGGIGGGSRPPSWAQGTFFGRNPQTGGSVRLDISANGSVTVSLDGNAPTYASIRGTRLTNGPYVSRVTRINNGIRTTDVSNGSYIDYFRTPVAGGPYPYPDQGGGQGNVPSWAVGTFYGRNPQTGGSITLTIQRNGSVVITMDGSGPTYASMNGTTLTNGPYVSRVSRINNGIRTTDVNNGSYIDYRR